VKRASPVKDLTGQHFGSWTVVGPHSQRAKNGGMYWRCKCTCGKEHKVASTTLLSGSSTQCRVCKGLVSRKRFCVKGHDTELWGRTKNQACRGCVRDRHLRVNYGITIEDFEKLFKAQGGKCAICGKELGLYRTGKPGWDNGCRIEVDHEHSTKLPKRQTVRGLLCGGRWAGCNRKLGRLDKVPWLTAALAYVKAPPARQLFGTPGSPN